MKLKDILEWAGIILLLLLVFFPWIAGIIDFIAIFLSGSAATGIPWKADGGWRLPIGMLWPLGCLLIGCMFGA